MASGFQINGTDLYSYYQQPFSGSTNTSISDYTINGTALSLVTLSSAPTTAVSASGFVSGALGGDLSTYVSGLVGERIYTTPGTSFTFTVPTGVNSICILCIGGSGGNYSRCDIGNSTWFGGTSTSPIISGSTVICFAGGGSGSGSGAGNGTEWNPNNVSTAITQYTGAVFNSGGLGANLANGGGGGAGGYSGTGGAAGGTGVAGTGGAGGGGNTGRGGGGVGLYGAGANGAANGGGGSGGGSATTATGGLYGGGWCYGTTGGAYGGGGGALCYVNNYPVTPGATYNVRVGNKGGISSGGGSTSGGGAVRILWGNGRSFPSTRVSTAFNQSIN